MKNHTWDIYGLFGCCLARHGVIFYRLLRRQGFSSKELVNNNVLLQSSHCGIEISCVEFLT